MLLSIDNVSAGYGDLKVLFDVSIHVDKGEVVSLVGPNGAGKTTLLNIISGFVPITGGTVKYNGQELTKVKTSKRAEMGIAHIPQGRGILDTLTVKENLILGAYNKKSKPNLEKNLKAQFKQFPILDERQNQLAGSLSGGQQQMLSIARALMQEPDLLILDEPSLGLAPIVVKDMFKIISEVAKQGMGILIVEQNLTQALSVASRGYVFESGHVVLEGSSDELLNNKDIQKAYLGVG